MTDQRSHRRHMGSEDAYLELTLDSGQTGYIQKVIACETVDLSEKGIRMYMSEPLKKGTITDILVEIAGEKGRFFLTAEVKWIEPSGDDGWFFAGFEIYDAENTDFSSWCEMVSLRNNRQDTE